MADGRMSQEMSVLAAARAALDPARAAWQNDILISAIIEVLARTGPITRRELKEELRSTWIGQRTSGALVAEALDRAWAQDLLVRAVGRKGRETWSLPEGVKQEADQDREWARLLISETEAEVRRRLEDRFRDKPQHVERARGLTKSLIEAMVLASRDVFQAVQQSASPRDLRAVRLNLRAGIPQLRRSITPAELADFVGELVLDAANPDERFANDLLSTIVAGQVLHGMVCRADLPGPMPPTLLVLDTSELLALASHDTKVRELADTFLQSASDAGCELVLTDRVEAEWLNHWAHADQLVATAKARWGDQNAGALKLYGVRVLSEYALAVEADGFVSFEQWSRDRRRLGPALAKFNVRKVDTSELDFDESFVENFQDEIRSIQSAEGIQVRSVERCRTDAIAADLVRTRRSAELSSLVPTAWFVARDRSSERAYERLRGDDPFPLTLTGSTWLLHYAAFDLKASTTDRATLADRITEDLILEAFLGVSASYTDEEMLEMGDLLADDDVLDQDDVRDFLLESFLHPEEAAQRRIRDVARARNVRRSGRVMRTQRVINEEQRKIEDRAREAEAKASVLQTQLDHVTSSSGDKDERHVRTLQVVIAMGILLIGLVVSGLEGWLHPPALIVAGLAWLALAFESYRYVHEVATRRGIILSGILSVILSTAVQVLAGWSKSPFN